MICMLKCRPLSSYFQLALSCVFLYGPAQQQQQQEAAGAILLVSNYEGCIFFSIFLSNITTLQLHRCLTKVGQVDAAAPNNTLHISIGKNLCYGIRGH